MDLYPLNPFKPGSYAVDLLGRTIVVPPREDAAVLTFPLDGLVYPPMPSAGPHLYDLCEDLLPRQVEGMNLQLVEKSFKGSAVKAIISSLFKGHAEDGHSRDKYMDALTFCRLRMEEQNRKIEKLLHLSEYWPYISAHFEKYPEVRLAVIVDVLTATEPSGMDLEANKRAAGLEGRVPIDEITGIPAKQDIGFGIQKQRGDLSYYASQFKGQVVVACDYKFLSMRTPTLFQKIKSTFSRLLNGGTSKPRPSIHDIQISDSFTLSLDSHLPYRYGDVDEDEENLDGAKDTAAAKEYASDLTKTSKPDGRVENAI
jgi:hypothetical protein